MSRFDPAHADRSPHPHESFIDNLIADGRLEISPAVKDAMPRHQMLDELVRFYQGRWNMCHAFDRVAVREGWFLLSCFSNGGNRFHVLRDENHSVTRVVVRGE
jgi:hypothetical protein